MVMQDWPVLTSTLPQRGFLPESAGAIEGCLNEWFDQAGPTTEPYRLAMAPHAGWVYSGRIGADVFRRIDMPPTLLILSPKHTSPGAPWAAAPVAGWKFPHATVTGAPDLTRLLVDSVEGLELDLAPHAEEHGIEVLLPLAAHMRPDVAVAGVTIAASSWDRCRRFGDELAHALNQFDEPVLVVVSSDLNHFENVYENRRRDQLAINALSRLDGRDVLETCRENQISMCGACPAAIALQSTQGKLSAAQLVDYATSAGVNGDQLRVVGYAGMLFD